MDIKENNIIESSIEKGRIDYWQDQIFKVLVKLLTFFGVPLLLFGAWMFYISDMVNYAFVEAIFGITLGYVLRSKKINRNFKKLFIIDLLYIVAVLLILATGVYGAGMVSVVLTMILAGIILNDRQIKHILFLNISAFLLLSFMLHFNYLDEFAIKSYQSVWLINMGVTQFTAVGLMFLIRLINQGLEKQTYLTQSSKKQYWESVERHKAMVANISDVITILDENGFYTYKSPNVINILGWHEEELIHKNYLDLVHPDDQEKTEKAFKQVLSVNEPLTLEIRLRRKNNEYSDIFMTAVNMLDNPKIKGVLVNYHDITNAKKAELTLIKTKEEAESANKAKSEFLSVMSHEIRTPLNGVLGTMQLLEMTEVDKEQEKLINISKKSAEALLSVIDDVLDYSKLEANKVQLNYSEEDFREFIHGIEVLFEPQLTDKGLILRIEIDSKIPHYIQADFTKLRQILVNLIGNAIKFTQVGFIELEVNLENKNDEQVILKWRVRDTGIGISMNHQKIIFDQFTQAEYSTTRKFGGTGLGLSICKRLVELMDGTINVSSVVDIGSSFIFTTILRLGYEINKVKLEEANHQKKPGLNVLIVEDDTINREILKAIAEKQEWVITLAENGHEAIEAVNRHKFDIILMDVEMPIVDGIHATKVIRTIETTRTPIIAMTAYALSNEKERCLESGMDDYLSKPINMPKLLSKVSTWTS